MIVGNGIANGTFMVAINRTGVEEPLTFYGSSFISDPYGRVLVQAPRDRPAVLVADLDLDQRRDWLELFPFLTTRRPDAYELLTRARASFFPGLSRPLGSNMRLTASCRSSAGSGHWSASAPRLVTPSPCSPDTEPPSRTARR